MFLLHCSIPLKIRIFWIKINKNSTFLLYLKETIAGVLKNFGNFFANPNQTKNQICNFYYILPKRDPQIFMSFRKNVVKWDVQQFG